MADGIDTTLFDQDTIIIQLLRNAGYTSISEPARFLIPNYVAPNKSTALWIISILTYVLAATMVSMRLLGRLRFNGGKLRTDDWLILAATIVTLGFTITQCFAAANGGGTHIWDLSITKLSNVLQAAFAHQLISIVAITLIKLSVIVSVKRICKSPKCITKKLCNVLFIGLALFGLGSFLAVAFQCHPIEASYDVWSRFERKCSVDNSYYAITSIGVATDIIVLILPMWPVWSAEWPARKKVTISFMILLGGVACICGVLRMMYLFESMTGYDFSWTSRNVMIWGQLEATLAIIATSLQGLQIFARKPAPQGDTDTTTNRSSNLSSIISCNLFRYTLKQDRVSFADSVETQETTDKPSRPSTYLSFFRRSQHIPTNGTPAPNTSMMETDIPIQTEKRNSIVRASDIDININTTDANRRNAPLPIQIPPSTPIRTWHFDARRPTLSTQVSRDDIHSRPSSRHSSMHVHGNILLHYDGSCSDCGQLSPALLPLSPRPPTPVNLRIRRSDD